MTDAEIRQRLADYMENDITLMPRLVAVEVRLSSDTAVRHRYDVVLIDEEGSEPVKIDTTGGVTTTNKTPSTLDSAVPQD